MFSSLFVCLRFNLLKSDGFKLQTLCITDNCNSVVIRFEYIIIIILMQQLCVDA